MRHAKKTKALLELERSIADHPSTLLEAGRKSLDTILKPEAIISRSQTAIRNATTLKEAYPIILEIANREGLKLHVVSQFQEAVRLMDKES